MPSAVRRTTLCLALVAVTASIATDRAAAACVPLACSQVIVREPLALDFDESHGGVADGRGTGTGFTYVDSPATGGGYVPDRLAVRNGALEIQTGPGINYGSIDSLENGLAVGVAAATKHFTVETIVDPPSPGSRRWEQAGLWVGTGDDDYVKLVVVSAPAGPRIQLLGERTRKGHPQTGVTFASSSVGAPSAPGGRVRLVLDVDVETGTVRGRYGLPGEPTKQLAAIHVPRNILSRAASADAVLDGSRFAGIFASHRRATAPLTYGFELFTLCLGDRCPAAGGGPGGSSPVPDRSSPGGRVDRPGGGRRGDLVVRETAGSLTASMRHPRQIRLSRLLSRGIRLRLQCSHACAVRARLLGSARLAPRSGGPKRARVDLGSGRTRIGSGGAIAKRLQVRGRMRGRLRAVNRARIVIKVRVAGSDGRALVLRSTVLARR